MVANNMTKKLLVCICCGIVITALIGLSIWDAIQERRIERDTVEVPIIYESYSPDDDYHKRCEATIIGLLPFGTREFTTTTAPLTTKIYGSTNYYCLAVLEDYSIGAILVKSYTNYEEWLISDLSEIFLLDPSHSFTIRGMTRIMPTFDVNDSTVNSEYHAAITETLQSITLLDTIGIYSDTEAIVPEYRSLGSGIRNGLLFLLVPFGIGFLTNGWMLLSEYQRKREFEQSILDDI